MSSKASHNPNGSSSSSHPASLGGQGNKDGQSPDGNGSAGTPPEKPQKPFRPMNRVPRACNACRKQKMKCTDAENPPCKRCKHAGIECLFEKPIRETMNNSEQGLRIRSLENQVSNIQSTLSELVTSLKAGLPQLQAPPRPPSPTPSAGRSAGPSQHSHLPPHSQPHNPHDVSGGYYSHSTVQESPSPSLSNQSYGLHNRPGGMHPDLSPNSSMGHLPQQRSMSGASNGHPHPGGSQLPLPQHPHTNGHGQPQAQNGQRGFNLPYPQSSAHQDPGHSNQPYRSNSDPAMSQTYSNAMPVHPGGPTPYGQHSSMPAPTTLPPFSQLDVHNQHRGAPTSPVHYQHQQNGQYASGSGSSRSPFPGPPLSPNKTPYALGPTSSSYSHNLNPVVFGAQNQPSYPGHAGGGHYDPRADPRYAREMVSSSNVTSADSSEDEGPAELPASGMVAPFEALRGMADVADRVTEENGGDSYPPTRSHSPYRQPVGDGMGAVGPAGSSRDPLAPSDRPTKRRKITHKSRAPPEHNEGILSRAYPDVVTKGLISESEARDLFNIFYTGCSMFLPVFDPEMDSYDALHKRSPFCVDAICMVAAKVRDGGGEASETYLKCVGEVHAISCASLFAPVLRQEVIQAMVIIAGWGAGPKDSGWLTCGHATRMAQEIGMHRAWPRLLKRIKANKCSTSQEERELVISARTWFCLYLFEHQMSFGNGRPAVLKEDESIKNARLLLSHPLSINDDMRLISMLELMTLRERIHNILNPAEGGAVDSSAFAALREYQGFFQSWLEDWSSNFAKRYEKAAFHMRSLQCQRDFAELYHNATALRTIRSPEDVKNMPEEQRELARRSMEVARSGLDVCLRSPSYREGMKYAVQYTHISATFAASFLIRLARLFPRDCDLPAILADVEELSHILSEIPAARFARTLKVMLRTAKRRNVLPSSRGADRTPNAMPGSGSLAAQPSPSNHSVSPGGLDVGLFQGNSLGHPSLLSLDGLDPFAVGFEGPGLEYPVWMGEPGLGDMPIPQRGLEAFLLPASMDERAHNAGPEVW